MYPHKVAKKLKVKGDTNALEIDYLCFLLKTLQDAEIEKKLWEKHKAENKGRVVELDRFTRQLKNR